MYDIFKDLLPYNFLLQFPDFGYGFVKIFQHIRCICFKIFPAPRSKSENFVTKIIIASEERNESLLSFRPSDASISLI